MTLSRESTLTLNMRGTSYLGLNMSIGCWCPGSLRHQDISNHDIDYGLLRGRISTIYGMSVWRDDLKYMFMFALQNLARKELRTTGVLPHVMLLPCRTANSSVHFNIDTFLHNNHNGYAHFSTNFIEKRLSYQNFGVHFYQPSATSGVFGVFLRI